MSGRSGWLGVLLVTWTCAGAAEGAESAGADALCRAAGAGDVSAMARLLTARGELLNAKSGRGDTALHAAVSAKQASAMVMLLKRGAKYRIPNAADKTAMRLAADSGSQELAARFLLWIPDVRLADAAERGDVDAFALRVAGDPDCVRRHRHYAWRAPWEAAAKHGRAKMLAVLRAAGAGPPADYSSALHRAAAKGTLADVRRLIQAGAAVNLVGEWVNSPLAAAAGGGDLAKVALRAMFGGALASWMTATIAGMLLGQGG